jgi:hypothetical protein
MVGMTTADLHHEQDSLGRPTTAEALRFYAFAAASVVLFVFLVMSLALRPGA